MRSRSLWPVAFLMAALIISAAIDATMAQMTTMGIGKSGGGGGGCTNSLDFSQACNSQYLPLLPGG